MPVDGDVAGMLVVDKPAGCTSHDVVLKVRRRLGTRAGHTGTLDPQATGVLLVCVGATTRLTRFLQHRDKVYDCTVRLGWATDSYDAEGQPVTDPVQVPALSEASVRGVLARFIGDIEQVPPVYSAKKIRGQPAYKRARRGEDVTHKPIRVQVYEIQLRVLEAERIGLRVHCGAGTYVRTLAHDVGEALGCPAHLETLRRLRVGPFGLDDPVSWERLLEASAQELRASLVAPRDMLPDWPAVVLREQGKSVLRNGGVLEPRLISERHAGQGGATVTGTGHQSWARVLDGEGRMVAVAEVLPGGMLQPRVVLG